MVKLSLGGSERNSVIVAHTAPTKANHRVMWVKEGKMMLATIQIPRQAMLPVRLLPLTLVLPHLSPTIPAVGSPTANKVNAIMAILWGQRTKTMAAAARR